MMGKNESMPIKELAQKIVDEVTDKFHLERPKVTYAEVQRNVILVKCAVSRHVFIEQLLKNECLEQMNAIRCGTAMEMFEWGKINRIAEREFQSSLKCSCIIYHDTNLNSDVQKMYWIIELNDHIANGHGRGQEEDRLTREFSAHLKKGGLGGVSRCKANVFGGQKIVYIARGLDKYRRISSISRETNEQRMKVENDFSKYFSNVYNDSDVMAGYVFEYDVLYLIRELQ